MGGTSTNTHDTAPLIRTWHLIAPAILQGIAWLPGRLLLHVFMHMHVQGVPELKEAINRARREKRGIIFACNHTSELDFSFPLISVPPLSAAFPMFYVVRETASYAHNTGFGWRRHIYGFAPFFLSWGAHGYIPQQQDYAKALPYHVALLARGQSVCIFPEGRFKHSPANYRVRGGVAYLAEQTNALTVPVYIHGARGLSMRRFLKRRMHLTVTYDTALEPHEYVSSALPVPARYKEGAEALMDTIHAIGQRS